MDRQTRPSRGAVLAALRNDGVREEISGIGYTVDLHGNWLADSHIFSEAQLEGNLDDLPSAPRQILERRAAAYMSIVPARSSHVPVRSASRPPGLARPSATSTWGSPSPDRWLLPRGGTEAWKRMHGMASTPTPTPTPAPLTIMPFADSSAINSPEVYRDDEEDDAEGEYEAEHDWSHLFSGLPPTAVTAPNPAPTVTASPSAGLPASLIMSPAPVAPSSFVSVSEEYQDDKKDDDKDDRDNTGDEDADAEVEYEDTENDDGKDDEDGDEDEDEDEDEDDEDDESHLFGGMPPAPTPGPARALAPTPTPSQTAPAFVPASSVIAVGEHYQDDDKDDDKDDKDDSDDSSPLAFPAALPAPAPTPSASAPIVGVPAAGPAAVPTPAPPAHPPAIRMPSSSFPAGFRMYRMPNRTVASGRFLVGPGYGGRDVRPPPLNLESLHAISDTPRRQGNLWWCPCSKWLLHPYLFMRPDNPAGARRLCNRCACREDLAGNFPAGMNDWLEQNQPVMFQLVRGDRVR
ncbi:hypothetical protein CKAH01_11512 [Colletotrichum kahawae]|uniref:Uncharacterized protein n=1 Tax=Colletotrichum kahawae TaxID=34407 RepID=A0AAD9YTG7_COLKA|nr:hypothetical protein CKAH01_11512 [Colletotrichum kahawae]